MAPVKRFEIETTAEKPWDVRADPVDEPMRYSCINVGTNERGELIKVDPSKPAEVAWRPWRPSA